MKKALGFLKGFGLFMAGFIIAALIFSGSDSSSEQAITSEEQPAAAKEAAAAPKEKAAPKVEVKEAAPVQVYSDAKVTISFKDVTTEGVRFLVENKTDRTLTIQADSVAINGFSTNDITMSDDIAPKSKGYAIAQTTELDDAGEPATVSGGLSVIDFDSNMDDIPVNFTNVKVK